MQRLAWVAVALAGILALPATCFAQADISRPDIFAIQRGVGVERSCEQQEPMPPVKCVMAAYDRTKDQDIRLGELFAIWFTSCMAAEAFYEQESKHPGAFKKIDGISYPDALRTIAITMSRIFFREADRRDISIEELCEYTSMRYDNLKSLEERWRKIVSDDNDGVPRRPQDHQ